MVRLSRLASPEARLLISKTVCQHTGYSIRGWLIDRNTFNRRGDATDPDRSALLGAKPKSMVMPPMPTCRHAPRVPNLVPGPDVIVGDLESVVQAGNDATSVGLGVGTVSCNNGDQPINWHELPATDHPVIPQNLYRMSGGADNAQRFEQIGQSWMKHAFFALEEFLCGTCNTNPPCVTGDQLCPGCADTYVASLNYNQNGIGSRAWIESLHRFLPIDCEQSLWPQPHWHVAPGHGDDERPHPGAESRRDLFCRSLNT